jgi:hypothetical protein
MVKKNRYSLRTPIEHEIRDLLSKARALIESAELDKVEAANLAVSLSDCATRADVAGFPFSAEQLLIHARELDQRATKQSAPKPK